MSAPLLNRMNTVSLKPAESRILYFTRQNRAKTPGSQKMRKRFVNSLTRGIGLPMMAAVISLAVIGGIIQV